MQKNSIKNLAQEIAKKAALSKAPLPETIMDVLKEKHFSLTANDPDYIKLLSSIINDARCNKKIKQLASDLRQSMSFASGLERRYKDD